MKIWELYHSRGRDDSGASYDYFSAELCEQPVLCYVTGRAADRLWHVCCRLLPPRWTNPRHDRAPFGPRLRFELWACYRVPRWRRRSVEWVRVADRDLDTWFRPGGDAPRTPPSPTPPTSGA